MDSTDAPRDRRRDDVARGTRLRSNVPPEFRAEIDRDLRRRLDDDPADHTTEASTQPATTR